MNAKQAYDSWKATQMVSMQVYTDVEMFALGFNTAKTIIDEMNSVIVDMEKKCEENEKRNQKIKGKE